MASCEDAELPPPPPPRRGLHGGAATLVRVAVLAALVAIAGLIIGYLLPAEPSARSPPMGPRRNYTLIASEAWMSSTERAMLLFNSSLPGPTLRGVVGEVLRVRIINAMSDRTLAVHFHGLRLLNSFWMDGVPMISHCPIAPRATFDYLLPLDRAGTFFYHSHIGGQAADGLSGALVVEAAPATTVGGSEDNGDGRAPPDDDFARLPDHVVFAADHFKWSATEIMSQLNAGVGPTAEPMMDASESDFARWSDVPFDSCLLNGKRLRQQMMPGLPPPDGTAVASSLHTFWVRHSCSYRLRLINAGSSFALRFSVDGHPLLAISMDGGELIEPVAAPAAEGAGILCDSVVLQPGERTDVILNATLRGDTYWLRAETLEDAVQPPHSCLAILRYDDSPSPLPSAPILPRPPSASGGAALEVLRDVRDVRPFRRKQNEVPAATADGGNATPHRVRFNLTLGGSMMLPFAWGFASLSDAGSQHAMALHTGASLPSKLLWPELLQGKNQTELPQLTVPLGAEVQLEINNPTHMDHPFHLHGHRFWVLAVNHSSNNRPYSDATDFATLQADPILKDTVNVPANGWTVLRFLADNPGPFLLHCHIEWHLQAGMAALLLVQPGPGDLTPRPPSNMPSSCDETGFIEQERMT